MISLSFDKRAADTQIRALMSRYASLPKHIAKKHLQAAMKRTLKDGLPILKAATPVGSSEWTFKKTKRQHSNQSGKRGQFMAGSGRWQGHARGQKMVFGRAAKQKLAGKVSKSGDLRRAATTKSRFIGRNADGTVYGVLGYKYGAESRKALWLEFGTKRGIRPRGILEKVMREYGGPSANRLAAEMAAAFEKAARELASGKNPGRSF
jgi:hypothetical protein